MRRREAREQAFCILFERAVTGESVDEILHAATEARDLIPAEFAEQLALGVTEHQEELDEIITKNLKGWSLQRLSKVAATLLRISVYEILYCEDVPSGVSINEAVELAKLYGGKDDPAYINGVLGGVQKQLEPTAEETAP